MKTQCENKKQGLKKSSQGNIQCCYPCHFWADFPKPLREREPDSLRTFLLRVWQPHVPWPVSTWCSWSCATLWYFLQGAHLLDSNTHHGQAACCRSAKNHLAWISADPCIDHLFPSSVKTTCILARGKTFLCDCNSVKSPVLSVPRTSTVT